DATVINLDQALSTPSNNSDILNALLSLGYNDREASWAIKQVSANATVSDGIRQALQLLSKEK
ncbi:MAG: RuvA C-terminal domain-containing protein, partial [Pseudomonadota bacterium]